MSDRRRHGPPSGERRERQRPHGRAAPRRPLPDQRPGSRAAAWPRVYEATDLRLDRTVAVKVMHPGLGDDDEFAGRFVSEARSAARLSHPNVVAVYDQGNDDGTVFLAMELVPGPHPARHHRQGGADVALPRARAARAGGLRARRRAPGRARAPRRQAGERPHRRRRPGQGRRLRAGQGGQRHHPAHGHRRAHRHRLLHRAGAGGRGPIGRARRRLRRRRDPLRAAHRLQAAPGRDAHPGRLQARPRGRPGAVTRRARHPRLRRRAGRPGHRPRPGAAAGRRRRAAPAPAPGHPGAQRGRPGGRRPGRGPDAAGDRGHVRRGGGRQRADRPARHRRGAAPAAARGHARRSTATRGDRAEQQPVRLAPTPKPARQPRPPAPSRPHPPLAARTDPAGARPARRRRRRHGRLVVRLRPLHDDPRRRRPDRGRRGRAARGRRARGRGRRARVLLDRQAGPGDQRRPRRR